MSPEKTPLNMPFYAALFALVVVSLLAVYRPAEAQRSGPYTLVAHSNETANVGIFRINNSSGQVSFCFIDGNNAVHCTAEAQ